MVKDKETKYYLCYWGEHVFPIMRDNIEKLYQYMVDKFRTGSDVLKTFSIYPPLYR